MSAVGSSSPSPQGTSLRSQVDGILELSSQGITKGRIHPPPPTPSGDSFSRASLGLQSPMLLSLEAAPWLHKRCPCNWGKSHQANTVLQLVATARLKLLIKRGIGVSEAGHKKYQICYSIYHSLRILLNLEFFINETRPLWSIWSPGAGEKNSPSGVKFHLLPMLSSFWITLSMCQTLCKPLHCSIYSSSQSFEGEWALESLSVIPNFAAQHSNKHWFSHSVPMGQEFGSSLTVFQLGISHEVAVKTSTESPLGLEDVLLRQLTHIYGLLAGNFHACQVGLPSDCWLPLQHGAWLTPSWIPREGARQRPQWKPQKPHAIKFRNILLVTWVNPTQHGGEHTQARTHTSKNTRRQESLSPSWRLATTAVILQLRLWGPREVKLLS